MRTLIEMRFGSHLYGTATETSDTDIKAVHLPDGRDVLLQRVKPVISRQTKTDGLSKNSAEDVDYESYVLQKYLSLAAEGQTVALDMLFAPEWSWTCEPSPLWLTVRANKDKMLTARYASFIGYCRTQANKYGIKGSRMGECRAAKEFLAGHLKAWGTQAKMDLIADDIAAFVVGKDHCSVVEIANKAPGEIGTAMMHMSVCNRKVPYHATIKRAYEMVDNLFNEYGERSRQAESNSGIDWKALSHAVRIGRQAIEVLETGNVIFPRVDAEHLLAVKRGRLEYKIVAAEIEELLVKIETAAAASNLPPAPDYAWIDNFVMESYRCAL